MTRGGVPGDMGSEQIILLVEDNEDDAELTLRALRSAPTSTRLVRVRDGVEALDYLLARGDHAGRDAADLPAVVLLDLNMPRLGGLEVLSTIRSTEPLCNLPVVILTSSDEESDRMAAYREFANCYVRKPVDYDRFAAVARDLGLDWMSR